MVETVKLTKIGEAVGVILLKELLARLDADNGDSLLCAMCRTACNCTVVTRNLKP